MYQIILKKKKLPINNIENYIYRINQFPILNYMHEYKISKHFKKTLDIKAAHILIITHLRFVVKISRYYLKYDLLLSDLIQEASIGLMKAIKRFDPDKNIRLVTFSVHWIKAEIHEYILKNWSAIESGTIKQKRKMLFNNKNKNINYEITFNKNIKQDKKLIKKKYFFKNLLATEKEKIVYNSLINNNWKFYINKKLKSALMKLDKRSREIIYKRYLSDKLKKYTLYDLSIIFSISSERVRQIEKKAICKLKKTINRS